MPARAGVYGDFGKLEAWKRLLSNGDVMLAAVSAACSAEILRLIQQEFRDQQDPYGKAWKAKKRDDGRPILDKSGDLKGSFGVKRVGARGFEINSSVPYMPYHQNPGRRTNGRLARPRRMMVPAAALGIPRRWRSEMESVAKEVLGEYFSGKNPARRGGASRSGSGGSKAGGKGRRSKLVRKIVSLAKKAIGVNKLERLRKQPHHAADTRKPVRIVKRAVKLPTNIRKAI